MGLFGGSSQAEGKGPARRRPRAAARPATAGGEAPAAPVWGSPAITVLLAGSGELDRTALARELAVAWPDLAATVEPGFASDAMPAVADPAHIAAISGATVLGPGTDSPLLTVRLGGLALSCLHVPAPAPGLDGMIQTTRTDRQALGAALRPHRGHLVCFSDAGGGRGVEATAHLFRLAAALGTQGALGLIHTSAWQAFAIAHVREQLRPENLAALTGQLFPLAWCNCIPFHGEGGSWMTSKGYSVAGVPDIAMWVRTQAEADAARDFLPNLFWYLRKGAVLKQGETIQMQGSAAHWRIGPVTEHRDFLCGPGETIALRPV